MKLRYFVRCKIWCYALDRKCFVKNVLGYGNTSDSVRSPTIKDEPSHNVSFVQW